MRSGWLLGAAGAALLLCACGGGAWAASFEEPGSSDTPLWSPHRGGTSLGDAFLGVRRQGGAGLGDDCGCHPQPVGLAQATVSERVPATLTVVVGGEVLSLEADTIEGLLDDGPLEAQGGVLATYRDLRLAADVLRFDRQTGAGFASGSVTVQRPPYQLQAESLAFNLDAGMAEAVNWSGQIQGAVRARGRLLTMTASRSVALDTSLSPCLADDPGYRFDFSRVDWIPQPGGDSVEGRNSFLVVGGVPVFWLPYFQSTFTPQPERSGVGPEIRTHFQAGYEAFDGFYLTSNGTYELAPGWTGRIPLRATSQRGITVGVEQRLPLEIAEGRLDAFYTTPFPGGPVPFFPGPRANLSLFRDLPGGSGIMSLGYRVEVNNPFRLGPFPALSQPPVTRLPEFAYFGAPREFGPLSLSPALRMGYLIEEGGASSPLAHLSVGAGGPVWMLPGAIRLSSFGSLRGDMYRSLTAAELAAGPGFLGQMARGVAQAGVSASAEWLGIRLGASGEVVRLASATPLDFDGTPFGHDVILPQDRLSGSARRHLFGPWTLGVEGSVAQPYGPGGSLGWVATDLGLSVGYAVNCLSIQFNYRPLIQGWGFSYLVTSF